MTPLVYFAAGCFFTLAMLLAGIRISFWISAKNIGLNLDKFELKELEKKAVMDYRPFPERQEKAGPVKAKTPARIEYEKNEGFNERLKEIIS